MGRTNVVIDDELLRDGMELCGAKTIRELVDLALKELVMRRKRFAVLEMRGCKGWEKNLAELRKDHVADDS